MSKSRSIPSSASGLTTGSGLKVERRFTRPGVHPFDEVEWELRSAIITNEKGEVVFEQKDVEIPRAWSQMATNVVVSKYFRGQLGTPRRETSVKQLIGRVVDTIADWGVAQGYFATDEDANAFRAELAFLCVSQRMAFNSPVWFNVGVEEKPQGSACFINSIEDTMGSILELAKTEGMLFKYGSGSGVNLSTLRGSMEKLKQGGTASGPVSFMRGFDAFAGAIKSGGATRRAAKMVILNIDHPDIEEFINCKVNEERKAWALIDAGYDGSYTGEAYGSVFFQNSNNSVRVPDEFMKAVQNNGDWSTLTVTDHKPLRTHKARELMRQISDAAWVCGDPGMQYDTIIQDWNCVANTARINATNPCFTGDTEVHTTKGLIRFSELLARVNGGEVFRVYTHNATSPEAPADTIDVTSPEAFMITGYKEVFRLRFANGMEVRCTPNHRFWTTNRGYVRAEDLTDQDRVLTLAHKAVAVDASYEIPVSANSADYRGKGDHTSKPVEFPSRWNADFAHYLGWMVGDGFVSEKLEVVGTVYGTDEEQGAVMPQHHDLVTSMTAGFESRISYQGNGTAQVRTGRKVFARFFKALGMADNGSANKVVPWAVKQAPPDIAAAFLRGLFDADGCVHTGTENRYVGLGSRSEKLVRDVQKLLTTFGIASRIYSQPVKPGQSSFRYTRKDGQEVSYEGKGVAYDLRITGTHVRHFYEEIGFSIESKMRRLEAVLQFEQYRTKIETRLVERQTDGTELTYNLTEPKNHSYVVSGLVVANCSEFVFIDDTACNLASLNLMKFIDEDGTFLTEDFKHAVRITITAQEMIVPNASYPTPKIEDNSHKLRPLGLGYANLGALLMSEGLPYDSDEGRAYGAAITSLMTAEAYAQSARISASCGGPFELFAENREPMLRVMNKHMAASYNIDRKVSKDAPIEAACQAWEEAVALGIKHGYRNAQATVLAPTGTIAFMMDCDTTGVEPDIALVKYKKLVGGGLLKIVNNTVPRALRKLRYDDKQVDKIIGFIADNDTIEGAPALRPEHLPVFDCAFKAARGERSIHYMGHLKMVSAAQPFISGSISKTINLPELATVEDIEQAYIDGWKMGLKCISVYRDNCKRSQPLNTRLDEKKSDKVEVATRVPQRTKLPDERKSITHKFDIQGHEGYITVSMFEDGKPGEIFVKMAKEGSTLSGMMDSFAIMVSLALQYGVPLEALVSKFSHVRFEPSGYTSNPEIPIAKSIVDYIFRWLASKFYDEEGKEAIGIIKREKPAAKAVEAPKPKAPVAKPDVSSGSDSGDELRVLAAGVGGTQAKVTVSLTDSMTCSDCGAIMVRAGACYKCLNCGSTSGCG